ncbi:MAG: S9 family peptidase [Armatimonadota bacterium]
MSSTDRQHLILSSLAAVAALGSAASGVHAQGASSYRKPPPEIQRILDVPPTPVVSLSPTRDRMALSQGVRYPPLADLAQPMLRLAGSRINPDTNGPHAAARYVSLSIRDIATGAERQVRIPGDPYLGRPDWSPDGSRLAFTQTLPDRIELWIAEAATGTAKPVAGLRVNDTVGPAFQWMPDSRSLLVTAVPAGRGAPPAPPKVPAGPNIQESSGRTAPVRTYQDLLETPHDAAVFDYYATAQLTLVDAASGKLTPVGQPGVYSSVDPSPDGLHLLVSRVVKPYSYLLPAWGFPAHVEVWSRDGKLEHTAAKQPSSEGVPIGGVLTGPRSHRWVPTAPATLLWAEAQDEGDPKKKVAHRDLVWMHAFPFQGEPRELYRTEHRFTGASWLEGGDETLVREFDRDRRWTRTWLVSVDGRPEPKLLWDRSTQDQYGDPGSPVMKSLPNGQRVVLRSGSSLLLSGEGSSPEGARPFLDRFDLATGKAERLFHAAPSTYESVVALLADDGSRFITRHETLTEPPNYFLRAGMDPKRALTDFPDPAPQLRGVKKQLVTYARPDGVPLSFTLYLPPGYREGQRLPTVVWAYPREYTDPSTAGQVSGSPYRFTTLTGTSHLFFLLQGYAVLDNTAMPVVGPVETANDTFVEQIVASAKAAIDKAVELGVTDPQRVGVGGHSYGAFMTANLLAHSDLFRAGIARSGAYNRSLTPFGFQSEQRTLWEAPEIYQQLSPFNYAHRIEEPLLLIHGEADNNPGTFPVQSERMFHAIKGNGGTVRYVTLPHESHGYSARESVEHTLAEMIDWFDRHVKNAPATAGERP